MKKRYRSILIALVLIFCGILSSAEAFMVGGFTDISVDDPGVIQAVSLAISAKQGQLAGEGGGTLSLIQILAASSQVVAGVNYQLRLKVNLNQQEKEAVALVYRNLSGGYELKSWEWK